MGIEKTCENCKHAGDNGIICDSCTWGNSSWEPKESERERMEINYNLMGAIIRLQNHPNDELKRISDGLILSTDEENNLIWESGHKKLNLDDKFEIVQKPVTFMEAVNSGKRIRPDDKDFPDYDYIYDWVKHVFPLMTTETYLELLNGTWYIG